MVLLLLYKRVGEGGREARMNETLNLFPVLYFTFPSCVDLSHRSSSSSPSPAWPSLDPQVLTLDADSF
jgi:hypothetical protein